MNSFRIISFLFLLSVLNILFILFFPSFATTKLFDKQNIYHVIITQKESSNKILTTVLQNTQINLEQRIDQSSVDIISLDYRIAQDRLYIQKVLESQGYYQAKIKTIKKETATIMFRVDAGEQYKFGKIQVLINEKIPDSIQTLNITSIASLKSKINTPALASSVIEDEQTIRQWIELNKCFFEYNVRHSAVVNNLKKQVDITYYITVKSEATFGKISFVGNKTISALYLNRLISIQEGNCFKRSEINTAKSILKKSGLFAEVNVILPLTPLPGRKVPVIFNLKEGKHRSIKIGVNYSTDIGLGLNTKWEHNNFLKHGEKLFIAMSLAKMESRLEAQLVEPFFLRADQSFKIGSTFKKENNEAYKSKGLDILGSIERDIGNKRIIGMGAKYDFEQVKKQDSSKNLMLLSVPIFVSQDKRDNILNPKKGWVYNVNIEPIFNTLNTSTIFLKTRFSGSTYYSIPVIKNPVIAFRIATGSIIGANNNSLPATKRFYMGGGNSLRGYEYQLVGPIDKKNIPLGGRSFVEFSTELRVRINSDYGIVTFIDGGNVYNSTIPNFKNGIHWGIGVGLRYYTQFGPLRVDIAFPLRKRSTGIDKAYQLYFSIGQAF